MRVEFIRATGSFRAFTSSCITIDFRGDAEENDLAIRSSLVYFKHRWPGQAAVITESDAFRRKVWAIAAEVGVLLRGAPGSQAVTSLDSSAARKPR